MSLKAIIFDLDETLLDWSDRQDTWETHESHHLGLVYDYVHEHIQPLTCDKDDFFDAVLQKMIDEWNHSKKTLVAPHMGQVLVKTCQGLGVSADQLTPEACVMAYNHELAAGVKIYPEVLGVLGQLKSYSLQFSLITNAVQPMLARNRDLEATGLHNFFEPHHRLSAADVGYLKPHPRIFEEALQRLNLQPAEAVFVGDSLYADIAGAQQAGMKAIWRKQSKPLGYAIPKSEAEIIPDASIDDLTQLESALDRLFPCWR